MKDQPSNADDDDREENELEVDELEDDQLEEEEPLTERQILERKAAEARRLYPHLISCHELRLMGAFDVPPAWRKSLSAGLPKRDLFSDLEDDPEPETPQGNARDDQEDDAIDDDDDAGDLG